MSCTAAIYVYSWTVLRSQIIVEESSLRRAETKVSKNTNDYHPSGIDEWCSDADDWGEDIDDSNSGCVNNMPSGIGPVSVDMSSEAIVSPAAKAENINISPPVKEDNLVDETKCSDILSGEPELLLTRLIVDDQAQKPVPACSDSESFTKVHSLSDAVSNKSVESPSNAATELEPYYVYVIEEPTVSDHSSHVEDLLTRYRLQEGSSFTAELESGNCTYVSFCDCERYFVKSYCFYGDRELCYLLCNCGDAS